jgi:hypothetical protein
LELDEMQATYEKIKTTWTERQKRAPRGRNDDQSTAAGQKHDN